MTLTITTEPACIVHCGRCGERSHPLDPEKIEEWRATHEKRHEREDRTERLAEYGHVITLVIDGIDMDWVDCHTECWCGWKSRQWGARAAALQEANGHLEELDAKRGLPYNRAWLINDYRKLAQRLGRTPLLRDIDQASRRAEMASRTTYLKLFGSIHEVRRVAESRQYRRVA
jgi:hypothetical protein